MPRVKCHYDDCVHLEGAWCSRMTVEFDPEEGCLSYSTILINISNDDDLWDDEIEGDDWEDDFDDDFDDDDLWLDDDDDF